MFPVFTSVVTAILIFDYWIIRERKWVVPDLFKGGPEHIYWYFHGINPRAWFAYIVTVIPSLRELHLILVDFFSLLMTLFSGSFRKPHWKNNRRRCPNPTKSHTSLALCWARYFSSASIISIHLLDSAWMYHLMRPFLKVLKTVRLVMMVVIFL